MATRIHRGHDKMIHIPYVMHKYTDNLVHRFEDGFSLNQAGYVLAGSTLFAHKGAALTDNIHR